MADEFYRLLVSGGNVIYVNNPRYMLQTAQCFLKKFTFRSSIPLIRRGALRPAWQLGFNHNYMLMCCKGDKKVHWYGARTNHDKTQPTDVWSDIPYQNGYRSRFGWHPESINIEVVERACTLCATDGDTILDPCMGAGTTAIASIDIGANFIGNEIREDYFQIARNRIKEHMNNRRTLFSRND